MLTIFDKSIIIKLLINITKGVLKMLVNKEVCLGCGACGETCPVGAITYDAEGKAEINKEICLSCGACAATCPVGAISED